MRREKKKGEKDIPEHEGEEKELRRGEKRRERKGCYFFTYGEEEEEEEEEEMLSVCCKIRDSRLFIRAFYQQFYRRIIKF